MLASILSAGVFWRSVPNNLGSGEASENELIIYKSFNQKLRLRLHSAFLEYSRNLSNVFTDKIQLFEI